MFSVHAIGQVVEHFGRKRGLSAGPSESVTSSITTELELDACVPRRTMGWKNSIRGLMRRGVGGCGEGGDGFGADGGGWRTRTGRDSGGIDSKGGTVRNRGLVN